MNKTRILSLVVGASLVVIVVLLALGFKAAPAAKGSILNAVGFGDIRRVESQQASANLGNPGINSSTIGMGDLQRFEAKPVSNSYAGFGDIHRLEQQEAITKLSISSIGFGDLQRFEAQSNQSSYAGFGDLRRFEAQQGK